jgi:hypothetical protein
MYLCPKAMGKWLHGDEAEWCTFHPIAPDVMVKNDKAEGSRSDEPEWCTIHPNTLEDMGEFDEDEGTGVMKLMCAQFI